VLWIDGARTATATAASTESRSRPAVSLVVMAPSWHRPALTRSGPGPHDLRPTGTDGLGPLPVRSLDPGHGRRRVEGLVPIPNHDLIRGVVMKRRAFDVIASTVGLGLA